MNASDWRKAAVLINHQEVTATTVQTDQLDSMPLSALSLDDSGPPIVKHGLHSPLAASTPNRTEAHDKNTQQGDTYQQIIPGIPQGSLYPTLSALSSGPIATASNEIHFATK